MGDNNQVSKSSSFNRRRLIQKVKFMEKSTDSNKSPIRNMKWVEGKGLVPIEKQGF